MPSGGARPGAGRPKKLPLDNSDKRASTKENKKPTNDGKPKGTGGIPALYLGPQKIGVEMDFESIQSAVVSWLKSMKVFDYIGPGLLEMYVTCLARARQCEQAVSNTGIAEKNKTSGQIYESPISKASREYMKRAQAAEAQIYQIIRDVGLADALDGSDNAIAYLLQGAPKWRQ